MERADRGLGVWAMRPDEIRLDSLGSGTLVLPALHGARRDAGSLGAAGFAVGMRLGFFAVEGAER